MTTRWRQTTTELDLVLFLKLALSPASRRQISIVENRDLELDKAVFYLPAPKGVVKSKMT